MRGAALPIYGRSRRVLFDARPMGPVRPCALRRRDKQPSREARQAKWAVFGMLKRGGKVFTIVADDTKSNT